MARLSIWKKSLCVVTSGVAMLFSACSGGGYEAPVPSATPVPILALVAGSVGESGRVDGPAAAARFNIVGHITADTSGNLFIGDLGPTYGGPGTSLPYSTAFAVRKIAPDGNVSTFADLPLGFQSYTGGIATDATGNVYLSRGNCPQFSKPPNPIVCTGSVVKVTSQRVVSTVQADGVNASFDAPRGIFVDATSNIYVAESRGFAIHKISPGGAMTSVVNPLTAPDGIALPQEITLDTTGNLYVIAQDQHVIYKVAPTGSVTTFAGMRNEFGTVDGVGTAARFYSLMSIVVDSTGNVYVSDFDVIRKITPLGVVTTIAGTRGALDFVPGPLPGQLGQVRAIAMRGTELYLSVGSAVAVIRNLP